MPGNIPLLDLSECGLLVEDESSISEETFQSFGKELYHVLSTSGFAYLTNHGIRQCTIEAVKDIAEKFFSLPVEVKKRITNSLDYGYEPIGFTRLDRKNADYQEGLRLSGYAYHNDELQWPNIPNMSTICFDLAESFKLLMLRLMRALASGMRLKDKEYFSKAHSLANKAGNISTMKFSHYPPWEPNEILSDGSIRIGKHSDFSSITLLIQDSQGGLQVETESGIFEDVTPIPGTIILNIGDCLQSWSAGRLRSTVHRVVPPKDLEKRKNSRRSIVYFVHANDDVLMEPLQFDDGKKDLKTNEKPLTVGQYVQKRFKDFTTD